MFFQLWGIRGGTATGDHRNSTLLCICFFQTWDLIVYYLHNSFHSVSRACFIASKQNEQLHEFTVAFT